MSGTENYQKKIIIATYKITSNVTVLPRRTQFRGRETDTDCGPRSQWWAHGNNIACINNEQSPRGCLLRGRKWLKESPSKSMTLARSGEHRWQSAVGSSPFRGEGRGPRRPPVRKGRSFDSLVKCRQVTQPQCPGTRASEGARYRSRGTCEDVSYVHSPYFCTWSGETVLVLGQKADTRQLLNTPFSCLNVRRASSATCNADFEMCPGERMRHDKKTLSCRIDWKQCKAWMNSVEKGERAANNGGIYSG